MPTASLDGFVGSSGTLIGAALETVGYYYQSWILDSLTPTLQGPLGAFAFFGGLLVLLFTLIMTGHFKFGVWIFLGPALFFASVFNRAETRGSNWIFGGEPRDTDVLFEKVKENIGQEPGKARVSSLFAVYNRIVSAAVRETSRVVVGSWNEADMKLLTRFQLYSYMNSAVVGDPEFRSLIHQALLGQCRDLLDVGREMVQPARGPDEQKVLAEQYLRLASRSSIRLTSDQTKFVTKLYRAYPDVFPMIFVNLPDDEVQNALNGCRPGSTGAGCKKPTHEYYKDAHPYLYDRDIQRQKDFTQVLEKLSDGTLVSGRKAQTAFGAEETLKAALGTVGYQEYIDRTLEEHNYTCHEIWNIVYLGLHREANQLIQSTSTRAGKMGVDDKQAYVADIAALTGQLAKLRESARNGTVSESDKLRLAEEKLVHVIARQMFRNEAVKTPYTTIVEDYIHRGTSVHRLDVGFDKDLTLAEWTRAKTREWQEKTSLLGTVFNLPYYQGVILYFLSVLYPFFAILLLIPGRHGGFLMWFLLWFWVKSWDIGIAIVTLLDEVLYNIFVANAEAQVIKNPDARQELHQDLALAVYSLRESDPSFQLSIYYAIVAGALIAIPITSAFLIMGSLKGGAGLVAAGVKQYGGSKGGGFGPVGGLGRTARKVEAHQEVIEGRAGAQKQTLDRTRRSVGGDKGKRPGVSGQLGRGMDLMPSQTLNQETLALNRSPNRGFNPLYPLKGNDSPEQLTFSEGGVQGMSERRATLNTLRGYAEGFKNSGLENSGLQMSNIIKGLKKSDSAGFPQASSASRGSRVAMDAMQAIASNVDVATKGLRESTATLMGARLSVLENWATWDAVNSNLVQLNYAARARWGDMFEIPWTQTTTAYEVEFNRELMNIDADIKAANTIIDVVLGVVGDGGGLLQRLGK